MSSSSRRLNARQQFATSPAWDGLQRLLEVKRACNNNKAGMTVQQALRKLERIINEPSYPVELRRDATRVQKQIILGNQSMKNATKKKGTANE